MKNKGKKRSFLTMIVMLVLTIWTGSIVYAQRPKTVNLLVDGIETKLVTDKDNLADALAEAGYENLEDAQISLPLESQVEEGMELEIRNLKRIVLKAGNNIKEVKTHATSVEEILEEEQLYPDEDDRVMPGLASNLKDGDRVELDYVEEVIKNETLEIPFDREVKETDDLNLGQSKVEIEGQTGSREIETRQLFINGRIVEEEVLSDKLTKSPVKEVVLEGTYDPTPRTAKIYSLGAFMRKGVVYHGGYKFTYYSQSVLPGGGLRIPGRHVNADGYVADKDGYIVLAGSAARGTVFATPFGYYGKIYDRGTYGNHLDVYTR